MLIKELRVGAWYNYYLVHRVSPMIVRYLMSYEIHHKMWRFMPLSEEDPFLINLLEDEVHTNIEPVHPTLDRYLSLFNRLMNKIDYESG